MQEQVIINESTIYFWSLIKFEINYKTMQELCITLISRNVKSFSAHYYIDLFYVHHCIGSSQLQLHCIYQNLAQAGEKQPILLHFGCPVLTALSLFKWLHSILLSDFSESPFHHLRHPKSPIWSSFINAHPREMSVRCDRARPPTPQEWVRRRLPLPFQTECTYFVRFAAMLSKPNWKTN